MCGSSVHFTKRQGDQVVGTKAFDLMDHCSVGLVLFFEHVQHLIHSKLDANTKSSCQKESVVLVVIVQDSGVEGTEDVLSVVDPAAHRTIRVLCRTPPGIGCCVSWLHGSTAHPAMEHVVDLASCSQPRGWAKDSFLTKSLLRLLLSKQQELWQPFLDYVHQPRGLLGGRFVATVGAKPLESRILCLEKLPLTARSLFFVFSSLDLPLTFRPEAPIGCRTPGLFLATEEGQEDQLA